MALPLNHSAERSRLIARQAYGERVRVPVAVQCELEHYRMMEGFRADALRAVVRPSVFGGSISLVPASLVS